MCRITYPVCEVKLVVYKSVEAASPLRIAYGGHCFRSDRANQPSVGEKLNALDVRRGRWVGRGWKQKEAERRGG
ncbi:hypothetical protein M0804_001034 [Polistes exclamans]|nr:hypothetical protein M0804_001034 [Polistes exclamans]